MSGSSRKANGHPRPICDNEEKSDEILREDIKLACREMARRGNSRSKGR